MVPALTGGPVPRTRSGAGGLGPPAATAWPRQSLPCRGPLFVFVSSFLRKHALVVGAEYLFQRELLFLQFFSCSLFQLNGEPCTSPLDTRKILPF